MDCLSFEKIWEDTEFYEVRISAQSDCVQVNTTTYITSEAIENLVAGVKNFLKTQEDSFCWENGEKGNASMPFISLEFCCKDQKGHIEIKIYMEFTDDRVTAGCHCCFALKTEAGQLSHFTQTLLRLNQPGIGVEVKL